MFSIFRKRPARPDVRAVASIDRLPRWLLEDLNLPCDAVGADLLLPEYMRARKFPRAPSV